MTDRRRFFRILYQAPAMLRQGQAQLATCIQDLSLHGLLLWAVDEPNLDPSHPLEVEFTLPNSEITLTMTVSLVKQNERILHLKIDYIDIESIAHLKRIVELNVGNEALLHRDIEHLVNLGDEKE
ncbi:PilZ domain-containing protein [Vibrio cincinnatiensis]|uniref:PilZ domain-containing protein n=1 Tax=Vibrio cincinnatiensis TaxID=675 RepID=UPI001EDE13D7|nr:PilZ domain-containing protein [Vibrio cincinnatiensis]MCG3730067.1 PilZ domain-containing protein [Vibrio cincinnatiensis]